MKRDVDMEKLGDFLDRDQNRSDYEFQYGNRLEKPIFKANAYRMDIYQLKWEEAFTNILKYLYEKAKTDFYMAIDVHKMFRNIEIPLGRELVPLKYYIDQLYQMIFDLRIKLYEMKLNSICRIKMPITANTDFIEKVKNIYNTHIIIENLMGDKLKYDQYIFIYNNIKFIYDSTQREVLLHVKDKSFLEDAIPKHVILQAIIHMTRIVEKLRERAKDLKEKFSYDNYIQMNMLLEQTESPIINSHEIDHLTLADETKKLRVLLLKEIEEIGRFWIFEGLINPEDRDLWLEAVEAMRNINFSVQNDIRDMLLTQYNESKKISRERSKDNLNVSKRSSKDNLNKVISKKSLKKHEEVHSHRERSNSGKKRMVVGKKTKHVVKEEKLDNSSFDTDEDSVIMKNKGQVILIDHFRPPYCWNYPYEKLKKPSEDERIELRVNDPRLFYRDGRVERLLDLLNEIKKRMIGYKGGLWNYIFGKVVPVLANMASANILPSRIG